MSRLLNDTNWAIWHDCMLNIFEIYSVEEYVKGTITQPNKALYLRVVRNWVFNNVYMKVLIANNIMTLQKVHVSHCKTAYKM
jgi:hypothetical protein